MKKRSSACKPRLDPISCPSASVYFPKWILIAQVFSPRNFACWHTRNLRQNRSRLHGNWANWRAHTDTHTYPHHTTIQIWPFTRKMAPAKHELRRSIIAVGSGNTMVWPWTGGCLRSLPCSVLLWSLSDRMMSLSSASSVYNTLYTCQPGTHFIFKSRLKLEHPGLAANLSLRHCDGVGNNMQEARSWRSHSGVAVKQTKPHSEENGHRKERTHWLPAALTTRLFRGGLYSYQSRNK